MGGYQQAEMHKMLALCNEMKLVQKLQPPFSWRLFLFYPHIKRCFSHPASHEFAAGDHLSQCAFNGADTEGGHNSRVSCLVNLLDKRRRILVTLMSAVLRTVQGIVVKVLLTGFFIDSSNKPENIGILVFVF